MSKRRRCGSTVSVDVQAGSKKDRYKLYIANGPRERRGWVFDVVFVRLF